MSLGSQELPALPDPKICHIHTVNSHNQNVSGDFWVLLALLVLMSRRWWL